MGLPFNGDRLQAAAALGMGELRGAYRERKRKIDAKAEFKRQQARTELEREKVKAQKAKEMADLEREMYEARLAAQQAKARAKLARHATGTYTVGERLGRFATGAATVTGSFYRGLATAPKSTPKSKPKPRKTVAKKPVKTLKMMPRKPAGGRTK